MNSLIPTTLSQKMTLETIGKSFGSVSLLQWLEHRTARTQGHRRHGPTKSSLHSINGLKKTNEMNHILIAAYLVTGQNFVVGKFDTEQKCAEAKKAQQKVCPSCRIEYKCEVKK